jgi:hypothetical protein
VYRRQGGEGGTLYLREEIKEKERRSRAGSSAKSRETPCRPLWSTRPELCRHHRHPSVEKGARTAGVGGSMPTIRAEGTGKIKCAIHQLPKITGERIPLDWAWLYVDGSTGAGARPEKGTAPGEASGNGAGGDGRTQSCGWSDGANARAQRGLAATGLGAVAAIRERRRSGYAQTTLHEGP